MLLGDQSPLHVDEPPTKEKRSKAWLRIAVALMFAVFGIHSQESLITLIGFCNEILPRREPRWTFFEPLGSELKDRKLSFGTQNASGSRYLDRILTASQADRLQSRNAHE